MKTAMLIALSSLLLACSSTPPTQFYTLDAIASAPSKPATAKASTSIGIGPVTLPALLDRRAIVTRGAAQSVNVTDSQQWAEPLLDNISRVINRNLSLLQPNALIHTYPWSAFGKVDTRIVIEITQFEAELGKAVTLEAVWSIKDEQRDTFLRQGRSRLQRPLTSSNTADMVARMNEVLAEFSQQLAQALP